MSQLDYIGLFVTVDTSLLVVIVVHLFWGSRR